MGSRQQDDRCDISMKGTTYSRLKEHCRVRGLRISGTVEGWISDKLDALGEPVPERVRPVEPEDSDEPAKPLTGVHFF